MERGKVDCDNVIDRANDLIAKQFVCLAKQGGKQTEEIVRAVIGNEKQPLEQILLVIERIKSFQGICEGAELRLVVHGGVEQRKNRVENSED